MTAFNRNQRGATLIELLIATSIFAVILLIIIAGFLFVSNDYIKGYVQAQTQETTRSILQEVTQDIQLSEATVGQPTTDGPTYNVVVGNNIYSYELNTELDNAAAPYVFLVNDSPNPQNFSTSHLGRELLGDHMRLGQFTITPNNDGTGSYTVTVSVYYGDNGVLIPIGNPPPASPTASYTYGCPSLSTDGRFCASSTLSATVTPRVIN